MQNRYLFRAKKLNSDYWVYGAYLTYPERTGYPLGGPENIPDRHIIISYSNGDWGLPTTIHADDVDPNTVGQCVDVLDLKGTPIYTGDLVKMHNKLVKGLNVIETGLVGEIRYSKTDMAYVIHVAENEDYLLWEIPDKHLEVIGTIYDKEKPVNENNGKK